MSIVVKSLFYTKSTSRFSYPFSVVYFNRWTLPQTRVKGPYWGPRVCATEIRTSAETWPRRSCPAAAVAPKQLCSTGPGPTHSQILRVVGWWGGGMVGWLGGGVVVVGWWWVGVVGWWGGWWVGWWVVVWLGGGEWWLGGVVWGGGGGWVGWWGGVVVVGWVVGGGVVGGGVVGWWGGGWGGGVVGWWVGWWVVGVGGCKGFRVGETFSLIHIALAGQYMALRRTSLCLVLLAKIRHKLLGLFQFLGEFLNLGRDGFCIMAVVLLQRSFRVVPHKVLQGSHLPASEKR